MNEETVLYPVGSISLTQANLANASQSQPKQTRLTISQLQHRALLQSIAAQLGTTSLKAALEHVLNCWLVGQVGSIVGHSTQTAPIAANPESWFAESARIELSNSRLPCHYRHGSLSSDPNFGHRPIFHASAS